VNLDVGRFVIEANILSIRVIGNGKHKGLSIIILPFLLMIGYVRKQKKLDE